MEINPRTAVVVYGGDLGLQIARSLGVKGIFSYLISADTDEPAVRSRYVRETEFISDYSDGDELLSVLLKKKNSWKGSIILPGNDESVLALSRIRGKLEKYYVIPVPPESVVLNGLDKKKAYTIAEKAGLRIPRIIYPDSLQEMERELFSLRFPCIIKPLQRHEFMKHFETKLFEVHDSKSLLEKFRLCLNKGLRVMISEIIPGPDDSFFKVIAYVDREGRYRGCTMHRKVRQRPPKYGVARVMRTIKIIPKLEAAALRFVRALDGYYGLVDMEFKRDEREGTFVFIEANLRNNLQTWLTTASGINIPFMMYEDFVEKKEVFMNQNYGIGLFWIHLYHDLFVFFSKEKNLETAGIMDYLRPYARKHVWALESISDPVPMLFFWKNKTKDLFSWFLRSMKKKILRTREGP